MSSSHIATQIQTFARQSFVVLPRFLEPRELSALRRSCDAALEWSRANCVETSATTARISLLTQAHSLGAGLLEPVLELAAGARVCALLRAVRTSDMPGEPQLKEAHYYHEQTERDWDGDWHRDSQFLGVDPDSERQLIIGSWSVHFRVAFEHDDRLEIVPASHARWDSDEELRIRRGRSRASNDMPNASRISLRAGEACLFHAWSIHRATYRRAPLRRTLDLLYSSARPSKTRFE
ncbi:MAG: phytanoyl-CoA dioxygenase family protein [Pseudomonadota bacterium]